MKNRVISWQTGEISVDKYLLRYLSLLYGPSGVQTDGAYLVRIEVRTAGAETKHSNLRLDPELVANGDGARSGAKPNGPLDIKVVMTDLPV